MENNILLLLRHDLHKIHTIDALSHRDALPDDLMKKADSTAAWLSRNWKRVEIGEITPFRTSLVYSSLKSSREIALINREDIEKLFHEKDVYKLHSAILNSKILNLYHEAMEYPYTSLKYHLLLVSSLYYNLINGNEFSKLYLCENLENDSIFQIIYKDEFREWALLPREGMSRVNSSFALSWDRRIKLSIGGDDRILDGLLSQIESWSAALATIDDFQVINNNK